MVETHATYGVGLNGYASDQSCGEVQMKVRQFGLVWSLSVTEGETSHCHLSLATWSITYLFRPHGTADDG